MRLHRTLRATNPRRVSIFIAEKGINGIEYVDVDLAVHAHREPAFAARSPFSRVPMLELPDGRTLTESRAIQTWLEAHFPEPNLMGRDDVERVFIEEADRQAELYLLFPLAMWVRHGHPGFAAIESPQFPDYAAEQGKRGREGAAIMDRLLSNREWIAGDRYSVADITAFCALEFARGLAKWRPSDDGLTRLQEWRDRVALRPSSSAL
jgi:glutathione S-transferase